MTVDLPQIAEIAQTDLLPSHGLPCGQQLPGRGQLSASAEANAGAGALLQNGCESRLHLGLPVSRSCSGGSGRVWLLVPEHVVVWVTQALTPRSRAGEVGGSAFMIRVGIRVLAQD